MTTLLLQTFLLLLGSFVAGCIVACVFKRLFFSTSRSSAPVRHVDPIQPAAVTPGPSSPQPAVSQPSPRPAETARFERALAGSGEALDRPLSRPSSPIGTGPVIEVEPPAPRLESAAAPVAPAAVTPPRAQVAPVRPAAPAAQPMAAQPPAQAVSTQSSAAAATAAAATAAAAGLAAAAALARTPAAAPAPAPVTAGVADDLLRIRAIDADLQSRLNALGVRRYAEIAAWGAGDVKRMSQSLGFAGRIEQENWIEQAQILSKGGETDYSRKRAGGAPAAAVSTPPASQPQRTAPVTPSSPPATAKPAEPANAPRPFGVVTRNEGSGAASAATAAAAAAAVAAASVAARSPSQGASVAPPPPATRPQTGPAAMRPPQTGPASSAPRDRLQHILGINTDTERILLDNGVTRYAQIAEWTPADVERFSSLLKGTGRIQRENWIEQAKVLVRTSAHGQQRPLHQPGDTRESSEPRPQGPRSDIGTLRSVRSEALRGEPDEPRPSVFTRTVGHAEDLKRIRGVGVLIEKKLHSLGITTYEQVANWTGAEIDRISHILDFKGRIERENWVEQARILAAGGQTEFSRRVDRGDVDSSKPVR